MAIIHSLHQWVKAAAKPHVLLFDPLSLTISGQAGTDQSVLIKTLITTIPTMFQCIDSCYICALTVVEKQFTPYSESTPET